VLTIPQKQKKKTKEIEASGPRAEGTEETTEGRGASIEEISVA